MREIIHLTDLHIGHGDLAERFEVIVDNVIYSMQPARRYIIVLTGDLVDRGTKAGSYEQARRSVDRLRAAGFAVLIIPGNHDYGSGLLEEKKCVPLFKEAFFGDVSVTYPRLDILSGIAFIGLDSIAEEVEWHDRLFAEGELGDDQRKRLDDMLGERAVRACRYRVVYLHHHPFDPLPLGQLRDSEQLGEILRRHANVDALLYGHNHAARKRNGTWGIARCYDGGSATRKWGAAGAHRVIALERDPRLDYDGDFHGNY